MSAAAAWPWTATAEGLVVAVSLTPKGGRDAIEGIETGKIDVSVCQNPYEMGFRGVRLLKALVEKDQATVSEMFPGGSKVMPRRRRTGGG